jgi:hypothetical protein
VISPAAVSLQTRTVCPIVHLVTGCFSSLIAARDATILDVLSMRK